MKIFDCGLLGEDCIYSLFRIDFAPLFFKILRDLDVFTNHVV